MNHPQSPGGHRTGFWTGFRVHACLILALFLILCTLLREIIIFPPQYHIHLRAYAEWYMTSLPQAPYPELLVQFLLAVVPALSWISGVVLLVSIGTLFPRWRGYTEPKRAAFAGILLAGIGSLILFYIYSRAAMPYYLYMVLFPDAIISADYLALSCVSSG